MPFCSSCGAPTEHDARSCSRCGHPLHGSTIIAADGAHQSSGFTTLGELRRVNQLWLNRYVFDDDNGYAQAAIRQIIDIPISASFSIQSAALWIYGGYEVDGHEILHIKGGFFEEPNKGGSVAVFVFWKQSHGGWTLCSGEEYERLEADFRSKERKRY